MTSYSHKCHSPLSIVGGVSIRTKPTISDWNISKDRLRLINIYAVYFFIFSPAAVSGSISQGVGPKYSPVYLRDGLIDSGIFAYNIHIKLVNILERLGETE